MCHFTPLPRSTRSLNLCRSASQKSLLRSESQLELMKLSLVGLSVDEDLVDLYFNEILAVALHLLVLLLALQLEDQDLFATAFAQNLRGDLRSAELRLELTLFA